MSPSNPPLEPIYDAYISAINARSTLSPFVHPTLIHNDRTLTLPEYESLIDSTAFAAAPDINFNVTMLVATASTVAARIEFDCTPQRDFLGCRVPEGNRKRVKFAEHVFYQFSDGKIERVWAVVDVKAMERQLGTEMGRSTSTS